MYQDYVDNFFRKTNASYVERYSDSSDFEYPTNIPPVTAKRGNHVLLKNRECNTSPEKDQSHKEPLYDTHVNKEQLCKKHITKRFQKMMANSQPREAVNFETNTRRSVQRNSGNDTYYRNQGDQNSPHYIDKMASKSLLRDKVLPCLSTIFRRSYCSKHTPNEDEKQQIIPKNNSPECCPKCERRRKKKSEKRRQNYAIQPNNAVVGNIHEVPMQFHQMNPHNSPVSHNSLMRNRSKTRSRTSSSGSDIIQENRKIMPNSSSKKVKNKKMQNEYQILNSNESVGRKSNKHLQYPSNHFKPYAIYTNASCQARNQPATSGSPSDIHSSSSSFWEYVAEKIRSKTKKCNCQSQPPLTCNLDSCDKLNKPRKNDNELKFPKAVENSMPPPLRITGDKVIPPQLRNTDGVTSSPTKIKNQVECECKSRDKAPASCQEPHDTITRHLAEKYDGQILCIHNPPCILINGCLNLPQPKANNVSNAWRVLQSKRPSFREEFAKNKHTENANQYVPPYPVQECLPEFRTEKIVQSICNHDPPCEVVHGCYKPKYDANLQNSCVHVPMCQKLPECMIRDGQQDVQSLECSHNPKCTELPLCSKKFLVLTAKEETSTQVQPKPKMVCRHQPPCLKIPKCIGRVICSETVPYDAIPDCVHRPCCEMIPACCRKAAKEMPSLTSHEEGISLKVPRIPLQQKNRLLRLIQAKRQF